VLGNLSSAALYAPTISRISQIKSAHAISAEGIAIPHFEPNGFSLSTIFSYVLHHAIGALLCLCLVAMKLRGLCCPHTHAALLHDTATLLPVHSPSLAYGIALCWRTVRHDSAAAGRIYLRRSLAHQGVACECAVVVRILASVRVRHRRIFHTCSVSRSPLRNPGPLPVSGFALSALVSDS
jgi:hypothetical protein